MCLSPNQPTMSSSTPLSHLTKEPLTHTSHDQIKTCKKVRRLLDPYYERMRELSREDEGLVREFISNYVMLFKETHQTYALKHLTSPLPSGYTSLDASRPWMIYWLMHSVSLLGFTWDEDACDDNTGTFDSFLREKFNVTLPQLRSDMIASIKAHQQRTGGFAGGTQAQIAHLATTYAAINSLIEIGTKEAYEAIDRDSLRSFLLSLKVDGGRSGVRMHHGGEIDVRGVYCLLSSATLAGILDEEIMSGLDEYVVACQTYEGGIAAYPGCEAHGGYTFCGLAAMMILKQQHRLDLDALALWNARRQMTEEGGFQGRTHKLVDACYSFWVGGVFPLLEGSFASRKFEITEFDSKVYEQLQWRPVNAERQQLSETPMEDTTTSTESTSIQFEDLDNGSIPHEKLRGLPNEQHLFNQEALQEYLLLCCQSVNGGLIDKPGRGADFYHTCYALSGLSIAQHNPNAEPSILGSTSNLLEETNPIFNVLRRKVEQALLHWYGKKHI